MVLATLTILGLLASSIERFVSLHRQFGSFELEENCTLSGSQDDEIQLHNLLRQSDWPREMGDLVDFGDSSDNSSLLPPCDKSCDSWTCTNDFIFAVALVVNLCELLMIVQVHSTILLTSETVCMYYTASKHVLLYLYLKPS